MKKGFSVIEILVVVGVFAVLGIIATQSINLSLKSSKKGDSMVLVKQELDNVAGNIVRLLQTASSVIVPNCNSAGTATPSVGFRNSAGRRGDIACIDTSTIDVVAGTVDFYNLGSSKDTRIASSSASPASETINYRQRLTSNKIEITSCRFMCYTQDAKTYLDFSVAAKARGITGIEGASVETSRKILIREAGRR